MSRLLHAQFCVDASGLPSGVLEKLQASLGKKIRLRIVVDTNFLFSILELHDNPSNEAARELQSLISELKDRVSAQLLVVPSTIKEAQKAILNAKGAATSLGKSECGLAMTSFLSAVSRQSRRSAIGNLIFVNVRGSGGGGGFLRTSP